jgi:hypothetical protein
MGLDERIVVRFLENSSLLRSFPTGSGAHPASYPMDTGGSLSGVKRLLYEVNHACPSNAELKREAGCTSAPPPVFLFMAGGCILNKNIFLPVTHTHPDKDCKGDFI